MAILALYIFGSYARKDQDEKSDFDLFGLTNDNHYELTQIGKINLSSYPLELAAKKAEQGDLFILHIIKEAVKIYDVTGCLDRVKGNFVYKQSYSNEISHASDLGWYLISAANSVGNIKFLNKRIAWCVRTILIALSAQERAPIFSATALSRFSGSDAVVEIIKNKENPQLDMGIINKFRDFLIKFGTRNGPLHIADFRNYFIETDNQIGLKTFDHMHRQTIDERY